MERKEVEKVVKETIFEKMGEFTGLNHAAEINNEDDLETDMDDHGGFWRRVLSRT